MEENKKLIEELQGKIQLWEEELRTVWDGKNTDAAEVERRNLRQLISRAKEEISELKGEKEEEELEDPEKLLAEIEELGELEGQNLIKSE